MPEPLTGSLMLHLESILFELQQMTDLLRDSPSISEGDRRRVRLELEVLRERVDTLMSWFAEQRLEHPTH